MRWVRVAGPVLAITLAGSAVLTACGGDDDDDASSSGSETSTTVAPEDLRASDADVAAGLAEIKATSAQIATTVEADAEQAGKLNDTIEPAWQPIEGTIKANDPDTYITFEDNFAALGDAIDSGDATQAQQAADAIATAADAYLEQYPG